MTKYGKHPWPTDGVTKKQLDRANDRLERRLDLSRKKEADLHSRVQLIEEFLTLSPHAAAWQAFKAAKGEP